MTALPSSLTATSSGFTVFLLGGLHRATLRLRLQTNELTTTSVALKSGLFDPEHAIAHLHDCGLLPLIEASS
jgi:hypothetical protein